MAGHAFPLYRPFFACLLVTILLILYLNGMTFSGHFDKFKNMIQFQIPEAIVDMIDNYFSRNDSAKELAKLSFMVKDYLIVLQNLNCSSIREILVCTFSSPYCGFGCHFHHHVACLMLSFALKIPLIHLDQSQQLLGDSIGKYLKPIGSQCDLGQLSNSTLVTNWDFISPGASTGCQRDKIVSLLDNGFPVPKKFAKELNIYHKKPFLWLVGQFARASFQLTEQMARDLEEFKKSLGISKSQLGNLPLIGMHVRRTDKYKETPVKLTAKDFMREAYKYRNKFKKFNESKQITIFIASEDCDVISEFRDEYGGSQWNFVGECNETRSKPEERHGHVFDVIRDVAVLADCDLVICTYTSNIGKAILELNSARPIGNSNMTETVISLNGVYNFYLWTHNRAFRSKLSFMSYI